MRNTQDRVIIDDMEYELSVKMMNKKSGAISVPAFFDTQS